MGMSRDAGAEAALGGAEGGRREGALALMSIQTYAKNNNNRYNNNRL